MTTETSILLEWNEEDRLIVSTDGEKFRTVESETSLLQYDCGTDNVVAGQRFFSKAVASIASTWNSISSSCHYPASPSNETGGTFNGYSAARQCIQFLEIEIPECPNIPIFVSWLFVNFYTLFHLFGSPHFQVHKISSWFHCSRLIYLLLAWAKNNCVFFFEQMGIYIYIS